MMLVLDGEDQSLISSDSGAYHKQKHTQWIHSSCYQDENFNMYVNFLG